MSILPNGDVIPHFMSPSTTESMKYGDQLDNFRLRFGEVQEIVYPDDERSESKKFVEYKVYVQERNGPGPGFSRMYSACVLSNPFAGLADRMFWTLRGEDSAKDNDKKRLGRGSKVLLLCINGETTQAVILGGLRDGQDASEEKAKAKDLGHHLYGNFNGVSWFIDKDGQLVVTYGGKTEIDGSTKVDDSKTGSTLKFGEDGAVQIADKDAKNAVTIDHANKKVAIAREDAFELGDATDHMLLGESFRQEQQKLNKQLKQLIQQAGIQLSSAVDSLGAPVVAAQAAGALLQAAAQAIDTFEQAAQAKNSFLSRKNKAD